MDTATRPFREILAAVDKDLGSELYTGEAPPDTKDLPLPRSTRPQAVEAPAEPEDILDQRQHTHGSFADNARVSQALKRICRAEPGWELLTDIERESMDMIALKFSRILSGKSLELQHWEDVVGYGRLAEEQCRGAE